MLFELSIAKNQCAIAYMSLSCLPKMPISNIIYRYIYKTHKITHKPPISFGLKSNGVYANLLQDSHAKMIYICIEIENIHSRSIPNKQTKNQVNKIKRTNFMQDQPNSVWRNGL